MVPKGSKWFFFGYFGGTKNGTSGARIKILRPLFNTNTPLKPPFRHFGNHFGPRKSDFWPFYLFWSFSHWNSHWSQKKVPTWEGKVVEQKQKQFWNQWTKWQNLGICKIRISEKVKIRIALVEHWEVIRFAPFCLSKNNFGELGTFFLKLRGDNVLLCHFWELKDYSWNI